MFLLKKPAIFFILLISLLAGSLFIKTPFCLAQTPEKHKAARTDNQFTLEDSVGETLRGSLNELSWILAGSDDTEPSPGQEPGAINMTNGIILAMITNPPVTTGKYVQDLASNFGAKPAYAQGIGWEALEPVLPVWKAFRNIAYMLFVIVFIVVGFLIMFRAKLGGDAAVTLQTALPRIVITLLLVTFSYALAGLMIDLIYIAIYLIVGVFSLGGLITNSGKVTELLLTKNPFGFIYGGEGGQSILIHGPAAAIENLVGGVLGTNWAKSAETVTRLGLFGSLVYVVLLVAVFFTLIKLLFTLLMAYLGIILGVIFAPFTLLLNALPGSQSFFNWLKSLFSNVVVFPVVAAMFILAAVLIGPGTAKNPYYISKEVGFYKAAQEPRGAWVPPFLLGGQEKSRITAETFQGLIALGMILMTPKVVAMVKKMLKVEPTGIGGAIVSPVAGAIGLIGTGVQQYQAYRQSKSQAREMREAILAAQGARQPPS